MSVSEIILLSLAIASSISYLAIQLWLAISWKFPLPEGTKTGINPPISVIIAARNEATNLETLLPSVLEQEYEDFEVILILDRCTDNSRKISHELCTQYPQLKVIEIEQTPAQWSPKKWALNTGIQQASYDWLAFTDADCSAGPLWLQEISSHIQEKTELILGIGEYSQYPGFLNSYIQFETFYTYFQYISLARRGFPYMGVGRNIAYKKSFFEKNGGFEAVKSKLSGDDDLIVNHYARPETTATMISLDSRTYSIPKFGWAAWFRQKFRHLSASNSYKIRSKIVLGIIHLSHFLFYFSIFGSLLILKNPWIPIAIYSLRMAFSYVVFSRFMQDFRRKGQFILYPLLDVLLFIYNLIIVPIGLTKRPEWK